MQSVFHYFRRSMEWITSCRPPTAQRVIVSVERMDSTLGRTPCSFLQLNSKLKGEILLLVTNKGEICDMGTIQYIKGDRRLLSGPKCLWKIEQWSFFSQNLDFRTFHNFLVKYFTEDCIMAICFVPLGKGPNDYSNNISYLAQILLISFCLLLGTSRIFNLVIQSNQMGRGDCI